MTLLARLNSGSRLVLPSQVLEESALSSLGGLGGLLDDARSVRGAVEKARIGTRAVVRRRVGLERRVRVRTVAE
jgi:hypothetical protein